MASNVSSEMDKPYFMLFYVFKIPRIGFKNSIINWDKLDRLFGKRNTQ